MARPQGVASPGKRGVSQSGTSPRTSLPRAATAPRSRHRQPEQRLYKPRSCPHPGAAHHGRIQHPLLEISPGSVVLLHRPPQSLACLLGLQLCLRDQAGAGRRWRGDKDHRRGGGTGTDVSGVLPCLSLSGWCPPCGAARTPGTCCGSSPWTWATAGPPRAAAGRPPASPTPPPWTGWWRGGDGQRGGWAGEGGNLGYGGGGRGGTRYLLVHPALLLAVARDLLDEVVQLLHQLQVAQGQLVRGDAENLPERREGPGRGAGGHTGRDEQRLSPVPPAQGAPDPTGPPLTPAGSRWWPS